MCKNSFGIFVHHILEDSPNFHYKLNQRQHNMMMDIWGILNTVISYSYVSELHFYNILNWKYYIENHKCTIYLKENNDCVQEHKEVHNYYYSVAFHGHDLSGDYNTVIHLQMNMDSQELRSPTNEISIDILPFIHSWKMLSTERIQRFLILDSSKYHYKTHHLPSGQSLFPSHTNKYGTHNNKEEHWKK